ncbi:MAG: polyribonucleotide nucleotidyltransferase [Planctomycetota bacterium]|jgi:polyribonucleotide nucleotidyltransferase
MQTIKVECEVGGRQLVFETGRIAKQADGAVTVSYGEGVVLGTSVRDKPREGIDFFPLTVDYREKAYAAGKFPGGFFKREGRPSGKEILTMRMIDRPIRPLFPKGFNDEIQIQTIVLAADPTLDCDISAILAGSAALSVSSAPFEGPIGAVRVGLVDDKFVINPTYQQMENSKLDMILAGHKDGVNMIEVGAKEISEELMAEAISLGFETIKTICSAIEELRDKVGKDRTWTPLETNQELIDKVHQLAYDECVKRRQITGKLERQEAIKELYDQVLDELAPEDADNPQYERNEVYQILHEMEEKIFIELILDQNRRSDGRDFREVRLIGVEVDFLPRTHGSALFSRGETQALVVATLGSVRDRQVIDGLADEYKKSFMLHYNFPPFCVGEARRIMGPGRREIGHGALAERSLEAVLPDPDDFPYTIRLVSEITESNGSSSMASVCGGTMALMDAGIPISQPVAGISIGSVHKDDKRVFLTDIIGEEDHFGDMDFKVAGTQRGITGIQLDLKERVISQENIVQVLALAKDARLHILRQMLSVLKRPRSQTSQYAPKILQIKVDQDKIGAIIGPGGKGIRNIEATTGATVDINDDGYVVIASAVPGGAEKAYEIVQVISEGVKVGKVYTGKVVGIRDFGAFIEVVQGQDGLCHISELADGYVGNVEEVCKIGDFMRVKVIMVDDQGRIKLSRKAVIREEAASAAQ